MLDNLLSKENIQKTNLSLSSNSGIAMTEMQIDKSKPELLVDIA
jgi:hypothetical protein